MSAAFVPRSWPFGVPYMAQLPRADVRAFRTVWCDVLNASAAGGGDAGAGSGAGDGAGGGGTSNDNSAFEEPETLYATQASQIRDVMMRARVPLAPLAASRTSEASKKLDAWLARVLESSVTFTGEQQTPGKLTYGQMLAILMRLRSAFILHSNDMAIPDSVQAGIINDCGPRRQNAGDGQSTLTHRGPMRKGSQSTLKQTGRKLSLIPTSMRRSVHRMNSGVFARTASQTVFGVAHAVHEVATDAAFWFGPSELLRCRRVRRATLEAFVAAGGAPDGTGTIRLARVAKLLQGTSVDATHALGGRLSDVVVKDPADGVDDDDDADDATADENEAHTVTLRQLGQLIEGRSDEEGGGGGNVNDASMDDGILSDDSGVDGPPGVSPSMGAARRNRSVTIAGGGIGGAHPGGALAAGQASIGASGIGHSVGSLAGDAGGRLDYRLTSSGKFVLQPWVKRPTHVTNARLERAQGDGAGGHGPARPVDGLSRRERRKRADGGGTDVSRPPSRTPEPRAHQEASSVRSRRKTRSPTSVHRGTLKRSTSTLSPSPTRQTGGRGLALLRAAMAAGRELSVAELAALDEDHTAAGLDPQAYDADLPPLDAPVRPSQSVAFDAAGSGGNDASTTAGVGDGSPNDVATSSDDEDVDEVAARYRTLQLPHIYGGGGGSTNTTAPPRAATSLEVRGRYSTAAKNTRQVDPNRAIALERMRKQQALAQKQAEEEAKERRRRLAAGGAAALLLEDSVLGLSSVRRAGATAAAPVEPFKRKRPPSNDGTLKLAAKLMATFEAFPARQQHGQPHPRPPVHMTAAMFRASQQQSETPTKSRGGEGDDIPFATSFSPRAFS